MGLRTCPGANAYTHAHIHTHLHVPQSPAVMSVFEA